MANTGVPLDHIRDELYGHADKLLLTTALGWIGKPAFVVAGLTGSLGPAPRTDTNLCAPSISTRHGVLSGPPPLASADRARDCTLAGSAEWERLGEDVMPSRP